MTNNIVAPRALALRDITVSLSSYFITIWNGTEVVGNISKNYTSNGAYLT